MNKIILSLAGVLAAIAFAPEASAVPAFARQTGMACSSCHFQKFPVLSAFGREFKAGAYTMIGSEPKVEGEHLSIPGTLNAALLFTANYTKDNRTAANAAGAGQGPGDGAWTVPGEMALFLAGRVSENMGFFMENNLAGGNGAGGTVVGFKLPMMYDMGGAKVGLVPFTNDGGSGGPANGYELSSTGQQTNIRWSLDHGDIASARIYAIADTTGATGVTLVARNEMGYINFTPYTTSFLMNGTSTGKLLGDNKYLRIAATPSAGGWDMHIGAAFYSGQSDVANNITGTAYSAALVPAQTWTAITVTKATALDLQAQGQVGGNDTSVYFSYAKADASTATATNQLNTALNQRDALTLGADYTVIPHTLTVGAAYRKGNTGAGAAGAAKESDNGLMVQATYDIYQNVALNFSYGTYSGDAYSSTGSAAVGGVGQGTGKSNYALTLEAAF